MTDFDPAQHRMVTRTALVRGFRARRALRDPEPHPDLGGVRRVPDRERRHPPDPLRRRILPRPRHAGPARRMVSRPWSTPRRAPGCFPISSEESLVGFLEQSSRFLKPVYADDTIYPALEVTELVPGRTTGVVTLRSTVFNQRTRAGAGRNAEIPDSAAAGRHNGSDVSSRTGRSKCRKNARKLRLFANVAGRLRVAAPAPPALPSSNHEIP